MIYRDDIPVKDWCEKHGITQPISCLKCGANLTFLRPFVIKEYAGIEGTCACGPQKTTTYVPTSQDKIDFWNQVLPPVIERLRNE